MFVIEQQQAAETYDPLAIQIKCADRRATRRRQSNEIEVIWAPREMLVPVVPTRMEKRHALPCHGIECVRLVRFGAVTSLAGQGEIVRLARSAQAFRRDVFGGMELRGAKFRRDAVLAVTFCALPDQPLQFGREALFSHAGQA